MFCPSVFSSGYGSRATRLLRGIRGQSSGPLIETRRALVSLQVKTMISGLWRPGDGKNRIRVTDFPKNEMEPAWSPDGSQIAFASNRDGKSDVFIIDVDWDELGRVISSPHKHGWRVAATMNNNVRNLTNDPREH